MLDQAKHPHLLAWYVSGDLDVSQARQTEEHLQGCSSCREELNALASMMQAVERASRELVRSDLRVEQVESSPLPSPTGSRLTHSRAISANATTRARPARPAKPTTKSFVIMAGMAGMVGLAGLAAVIATGRITWLTWPSGARTTTPREVRPLTFSPLARGGAGAPRLSGQGPWAIRVILPFGAAEGTYLVRIEPEPSGSNPVIKTMTPTDADGNLTLILDTLAEPGRYSMVLTLPDQAGPSYSYLFEIIPADAPTAS